MRFIGSASGGSKPTTPTIGAATDDGTGTGVSVAFTPSTYIGKGTITYTATSSPGSLTASGAGSPLVVSGLTTGTAYTFTVKGTTNYGVVSDSSAASNSVTPASPSSYESIATFTGDGTAKSYTFSSIPSTYKSLQIRIYQLNGQGLIMRLNGDTATNYSYHGLYAYGDNAGSPLTVYTVGVANTNAMRFQGQIGTATSTFGYASIINMIDYASTSKYKTIRTFSGNDQNGVAEEIDLYSGNWRSLSAVNSITIFANGGNNLASGSSIALYGVK